MIFGMVSTRASVIYTQGALRSFFTMTTLGPDDRFILIVNESGALPDLTGVDNSGVAFQVVLNALPQSFAQNVNTIFHEAIAHTTGVVFLNNDVIFTPHWLEPLIARGDAISISVCNQQYQYEYDGLQLRYHMDWDDYQGRLDTLAAIAAMHNQQVAPSPPYSAILMPFFCFHAPFDVINTIGYFDTTFGMGGGEDVDYRLRATLAGFDVTYAPHSFLLHFMGKSTWRGGEDKAETAARNVEYRRRFEEKWGPSLGALFLSGADAADLARRVGVEESIAHGDYLDVIKRCRALDRSTGGAKPRPTICLSMIVKNEAPVLRRCLDSVRALIDYCIIVDTGSTDSTKEVVREFFSVCPGELHERAWVDFAFNRTEALKLSRGKADYTLIIDADDLLQFETGFVMPDLTHDSYLVDISDTGTSYQRIQLVSNKLDWRYEGVLHEFLVGTNANSQTKLSGVTMKRNHDGSRRRDPLTYQKDAAVLEKALQSETDPFFISRYTFYLAQSYRDCGEREKSLEAYLKRTKLGFWDQEVYIAFYSAAKLMHEVGRPSDEVIACFKKAIEICPWRAEAYHGASFYLREKNRFLDGLEIARPALDLVPAGGLFVNEWIYRFGLLDEFAVNAYWAGKYQECLDACNRILALDDLSPGDRGRIKQNAKFASDKLGQATVVGSPKSNERGTYAVSSWLPSRPQGGTEMMVEGLRERLGSQLESIDLKINLFSVAELTGKPLVVWVHHDVDQAAVQWFRDQTIISKVEAFVFVSHWQRERYIREFGILSDRCVVLRNAISMRYPMRRWQPGKIKRVAYTSTPYRGLSVLLDAWEKLQRKDAELHIWSSTKLYGQQHSDDTYNDLFRRADSIDNVYYRGLLPNNQLRDELRLVDYLAYPSIFPETSCLSVIEAMASGCRVVCPALGALPETTSGFARIYYPNPDSARHADIFSKVLNEELDDPWSSGSHLSWSQQEFCHMFYDWEVRVSEWRGLLKAIGSRSR